MADDGRLHVVIDGDARELQKTLQNISKHFNSAKEEAEKLGDTIDGSLKQGDSAVNGLLGSVSELKGAFAAAFSIAGAKSFLEKVYETRSYFQDIESSMKVFLGNEEKATEFTEKLKDYAYYNMFEFSDLAQASQQLIAYGNSVDDVIGILDKLSNIATATKVPLMEMVGLYNRAKNLGGVDSKSMYSWAAKGVVLNDILKGIGEEVNGTTLSFEQLNKAIDAVTGEGGMFHGLMDEMMPNLSSSMGQLQDELSGMFNEIGEFVQKPMHDAIDLASAMVGSYKEIAKVVAEVAGTYGVYKAALLLLNAAKAVSISLSKGYTAAELIQYNALLLVEKAQAALNKSLLANPYTAAAAAVAALAYALYKLVSADNAVEKARKNHAAAMEELSNSYDEATTEAQKFIGIIQDKDAQEGQRTLAYEKLKKLVPQLTEVYSQEELAVMSLTEAYAKLQEVQDRDEEKALYQKWESATESVKKYQDAMDKAQKAGNQYMFLRAKEGKAGAEESAKLAFDAYVKKSRENAMAYVPDQNANKGGDVAAKDNKAYWENVKKEAEDAYAALTETELKTKKAADLLETINKAKQKLVKWDTSGGKSKDGSNAASDQKSYASQVASMQKTAADAEVNAIEDADTRTLAALRLKHQREIAELEAQKAKLEELAAQLGATLDIDFDSILSDTIAAQNRESREATSDTGLAKAYKRIDNPATAGKKSGLAGVGKTSQSIDVSPNKGADSDWKELYETLTDVNDTFESIGDSVGGTVGEMISGAGEMVGSTLSMINGITTLANSSMEGMQGTSEGAKESMSAVEKASVILAIVSAAIQIISKIVSLVKKLKESSQWMDEFNAEVAELNYELERTKLAAKIAEDKGSIFGENAWANAVKNVDAAREALARYNDTVSSTAASIGDMQLQMRHSTWFRSAKYTSLKDAVPELFDEDGSVNKDALKEFLGSDTFKRLSEENQEYLQKMSDAWEDFEDANDEVRSYLESLFGDMGDGLTDALVDAFRNGTDAAEAFGQTADEVLENFIEQIAYSAVFGNYFEKMQEKANAIIDNESLSDEDRIAQMERLVEQIKQETLAKQGEYEAYLQMGKDAGLYQSDAEREGTSKGIATASQESVDENNARLTTIQGYAFNVQENTASLVRQSASMLEQLCGIRDNTARLAAIESAVKDMRDHGVRAL